LELWQTINQLKIPPPQLSLLLPLLLLLLLLLSQLLTRSPHPLLPTCQPRWLVGESQRPKRPRQLSRSLPRLRRRPRLPLLLLLLLPLLLPPPPPRRRRISCRFPPSWAPAGTSLVRGQTPPGSLGFTRMSSSKGSSLDLLRDWTRLRSSTLPAGACTPWHSPRMERSVVSLLSCVFGCLFHHSLCPYGSCIPGVTMMRRLWEEPVPSMSLIRLRA